MTLQLENYGVSEMNQNEIEETNGGSFIIGLLIFSVVLLIAATILEISTIKVDAE